MLEDLDKDQRFWATQDQKLRRMSIPGRAQVSIRRL